MSKWKFQRPPWSASEFCCALSATFHFYCFWKSASTWFHLGPASSWLSKPRPKQICIVTSSDAPFVTPSVTGTLSTQILTAFLSRRWDMNHQATAVTLCMGSSLLCPQQVTLTSLEFTRNSEVIRVENDPMQSHSKRELNHWHFQGLKASAHSEI